MSLDLFVMTLPRPDMSYHVRVANAPGEPLAPVETIVIEPREPREVATDDHDRRSSADFETHG
jgi:hypothetical protein